MFYWDDHVIDPELTPLNGASPETFGVGTTLAKVDDFTVKFTFETPFPAGLVYALAYGTFCPGPSHIMKPLHPKYSDNTYEQYTNAFPPTYMNFPVMGAWVPVEYRPDDIVVMRRNPYYWKVDENGHQLPYLDELNYRLSTWADRDVQAVAGTGDFSNLEQPENFVESLRRGAEETAPARLEFGPADHRLLDVPELLRQRLGLARRARPGDPRAQPRPELPHGAHLGDRPRSASATRWSRGRSPRSTRAA